jgi:hypothetical protein
MSAIVIATSLGQLKEVTTGVADTGDAQCCRLNRNADLSRVMKGLIATKNKQNKS